MIGPSTRIALLLVCLTTTACDSSDNDTQNMQPVSSEFHEIQPADVQTYVAEYQAQRARVKFTIDGVEHALKFEDLDQQNNQLLAGYDNKLLSIGFDLESATPLPTLSLFEIQSDDIVDRLTTDDLLLTQSPTADTIYSGTLADPQSERVADVTLVLNESLISGGGSEIQVNGTDAVLNGDLGTGTYVQVRAMISANPAVARLILRESSGSLNDAINVHTGRMVRGAGLTTHVPADGNINSGAVDLFAAGVNRSVEPGGVLGVHAWCCENGVTADNLSRNDSAHGTQLTYFRQMLPLTGENFYFFTLQAAPFDGIHAMTRDEMQRFELITE